MNRYVIVFRDDKDGLVKLVFTNQAQFHYDSKSLAEKAVKEIVSDEVTKNIFSQKELESFGAIEVECWENGDSKRTVW